MADERMFQVKIITPDRVFYQGEASMLEFNTTEGEIGILPGHIPLTTIISPGVLRIREAEGVKEAALHAGFVEILQESVTILAEVVEWPDEIDLHRAEEAKIRAERRLAAKEADTNILRAETALHRALTRIHLVSNR